MTEKMEVNTISKHGWNLKGQTIRGKFFGNMENHLFSMLVFVLIVLMSLISCKHEPDENKPGNEVDLDIFAVDISAETDWNYMVVGKDGSSMVFNADESTGIPSLLYLKPEKDSDDGFTYLFKENGLPDKLIHNGHILYFGNFSGYTFDLAVIYPNDTIEYHYGIETDINWDAYNETSPSGQPRSILDIFSNPYVKHGIGVGTCIAGVFYAPLLIGCTSYVGKLYVDTVTTYAFPELDGAPADVIKAIIDVFGCAGGAIGNCVSGAAEALHLLTYLDFNLAEQKTTQINEAIRRIDGDVLTLIPRELLEYFYDLGITINSGRNPPNIEGTYLVPTLQLMRKTTSTNITEQWDKYVTFSRQDSTSLTVNVDYIMQSDNGSMSLSGLGFIVGEGNKYTVVIDGTREEEGYTARTIEAFSGEITATGISDYQWGIFMVDNRGDPLGHWIANGTGYSKRGTAVKFDPNQPGLANNPVPLTADTWTTGSITSGGLNEIWYSFNVVSGTSYSIGWSDSYEGAGSHTLDIVVSAQYENGTSIFSGIDSAYYTPRTFTANQTGAVKIKVYPYSSGRTGTYALTYVVYDPNQPGSANNPIPLTADIWTIGSITSGGLNEICYSFGVVNGTSYSIWWSDSYEGTGSHTLDIVASAQYGNGTSIFSDVDSAYDTPSTFIANQTGTVKIRVYPYYSERTGTYALTYSVDSTAIRPSLSVTVSPERTLSVNHVQGIKEVPSETVPSGARH